MDLFGEFEWRGLVYDATEGCATSSRARSSRPTSVSIRRRESHVGSLLPIVALARLQRFGILRSRSSAVERNDRRSRAAKTVERMLSAEQVEANVEGFASQLRGFSISRQHDAGALVNNAEWLTRLGAIEFMRMSASTSR
jgi:tyrosyl-tRNA synthetase